MATSVCKIFVSVLLLCMLVVSDCDQFTLESYICESEQYIEIQHQGLQCEWSLRSVDV